MINLVLCIGLIVLIKEGIKTKLPVIILLTGELMLELTDLTDRLMKLADVQAEFGDQLGPVPARHELLLRLQAVARPQWGKAVQGYVRDARRHACAQLA